MDKRGAGTKGWRACGREIERAFSRKAFTPPTVGPETAFASRRITEAEPSAKKLPVYG